MAHDYKNYPELTNKQLEEEGFMSPHKQITEDFEAKVVKVHDGDTITLEWSERDFHFPMRFLDIDAPEMNAGGEEAKAWLTNRLLGKKVQILINLYNRVDKYGRLLGKVLATGLEVGQEMLNLGLVKTFISRYEDQLPIIAKELNIKKWL